MLERFGVVVPRCLAVLRGCACHVRVLVFLKCRWHPAELTLLYSLEVRYFIHA